MLSGNCRKYDWPRLYLLLPTGTTRGRQDQHTEDIVLFCFRKLIYFSECVVWSLSANSNNRIVDDNKKLLGKYHIHKSRTSTMFQCLNFRLFSMYVESFNTSLNNHIFNLYLILSLPYFTTVDLLCICRLLSDIHPFCIVLFYSHFPNCYFMSLLL